MVASRCRFAQRSRHAGTTFRDFVPISLSGLFLRVACLTGTHICATLAPRWHNVGAVLAPYSSRWRHAGCVRRRHVGFETHIYATLAPRWHNVGASVVPNLPTLAPRWLRDAHLRHVGATLARRWRRVGAIFTTLAPLWLRTLAPRWLRDAHLRHIGATLARRWRRVWLTWGGVIAAPA